MNFADAARGRHGKTWRRATRAAMLSSSFASASCGAKSELIAPYPDVVEEDAPSHDEAERPDVLAPDAPPCFEADLTPWQFHDTPSAFCVPTTFTMHGEPAEFEFAGIPSPTDPGWMDYASATIDFSRRSRLCGMPCDCLNGVDFDYWQTFLSVPAGLDVTTLTFSIANVDDGAHVTIFNDRFPSGTVAPGSFVQLFGSTTANLATFIVAGQNRIVLTHVDDCCSGSFVMGATIRLNGTNVPTCM